MKRIVLTGILALAAAAALLAQQKQPTPKSKGEVEAIQAIFQAQDPKARIGAAENLLTKYADTEFKGLALYLETVSYQQLNDFDKVVIYGERTLEVDPNNFQVMLILAEGIAQHTRENDLDKADKIAKVNNYVKKAFDTMKDAPKPNPNLTDEQWTAAKKDLTAQGHQALGLAAMAEKKYDVAVNEFKTAVDTASQPDTATMVRLGAAYNLQGKYDDAIAVLDKVMATPDVHPTIKQFAQAERVRAVTAKGGAKPAAPAAPAPPQVEIKK